MINCGGRFSGKALRKVLRKLLVLNASLFIVPFSLYSATSEIRVDLKLDAADFVVGESIRGVVNIVNSSPDKVSYGYSNSRDHFFIEVYRASDMSQLTRVSDGEFVSRFMVKSGEGQKLETFLGRHYSLREPSRYLAKPVLVHGGMRYEGQPRAFDIVEGVKVGSAMQMFKRVKGLQREFELVYWSRREAEHIFIKAKDSTGRIWETRDLGLLLRIEKPVISVLANGEVIVLHRYDRDWFSRTVYWSLPKTLEFRGQENVQDPETAGTQRVRELYKDGVKPKDNPWWKFW